MARRTEGLTYGLAAACLFIRRPRLEVLGRRELARQVGNHGVLVRALLLQLLNHTEGIFQCQVGGVVLSLGFGKNIRLTLRVLQQRTRDLQGVLRGLAFHFAR